MLLQQQLLFSINEVAELLQVDRQTVARYIKQGKIKIHRIAGKTIRIPRSEIEYLLSDQKGTNG